MSLTWEEKLHKTEQKQEDRRQALERMGISVQSSGIKVQALLSTAGGQETGSGEDGDISTVQWYQGKGSTKYSRRTGDMAWRGWGYQYSLAVSRYRQY